ncbi:MAG: MucBP domain-containing protein [Lactobacillaceae bacterium]|jgi:mannose-6-phosphate isomerase|nr:MucBP domain-containing protein [Lactobacillaceae bacterium]
MSEFGLQGTPVWVYKKEAGTNKSLGMAEIIQGELGAPFKISAPVVEGYVVDNVSGALTGVFSDQTQRITVYYRQNNVAQIEKMSGKILHITGDTQTYAEPDLKTKPLQMVLNAGTDWPIVSRMATTKGLFWHQISDSRWVLYDRKTMTIEKRAPKSTFGFKQEFDWTPESIYKTGTLIEEKEDWPVKVYSKPYGSEVNELTPGLTVILNQVLHDPSGKDWYEISGQGWVDGINLTLTK